MNNAIHGSMLYPKLMRKFAQFWPRDSTPPSSLDLEWEHEGIYSVTDYIRHDVCPRFNITYETDLGSHVVCLKLLVLYT